jgi:transcriptional regulator with XRE-family HTH domain
MQIYRRSCRSSCKTVAQLWPPLHKLWPLQWLPSKHGKYYGANIAAWCSVIAGPVLVPENLEVPERGIQVARAVKDLRRRNGLSQRELAGRMGVPRTYISKIENEKAVPTLGSLNRLARALEVHICVLLRDDRARLDEEATSLMSDPFLSEMLPFVRQMDALQRSIFLNQARELAVGRRRTA